MKHGFVGRLVRSLMAERPRRPDSERVDIVFQGLAKPFLAANPSIRHEWRLIRSAFWGDRVDLVCDPESDREVFATLRRDEAVVGDKRDREKFQDFDGSTTASALARDAFEHFVNLMRNHGFVRQAS